MALLTRFRWCLNCCVFRPANTCFWKSWKSYLFHKCVLIRYFCSWTWEDHVEKQSRNNKIPNEQSAFGCQPAFASHSQSLTNKLFSLFFFMGLTWASRPHDRKGTFFMIFECLWMFFIVFNHVNTCESMRSLVKIHNTEQFWTFRCLETSHKQVSFFQVWYFQYGGFFNLWSYSLNSLTNVTLNFIKR